MFLVRFLAGQICLCVLACLSARATNLVTGNGFGFAVLSPERAALNSFYAHPYRFMRPDPKDPLSEGVPTTNFIKSLGWSSPTAHSISADYEEESHVIHSSSSAGEGFFFMPFGLQQSALVISWTPSATSQPSEGWKVEWSRPIEFHRTIQVNKIKIELLKFDGVEESLLLFPLGEKRTGTTGEQYLSSRLSWVLVSVESERELGAAVQQLQQWQSGLRPRDLVKREITDLERWRVRPPAGLAGKNGRRLWRQSEVMLRIAQSREPNRPGRYSNGLNVASVPEGMWFTPWVRDMAWATVALARMGHRKEARAALLAYFNARPTGKMRDATAGADYQISVVRYFGDGSEEPFFSMEGETNIELDDWGEVLWVLGEYLHRYNDPALLATPTYRGTLYESARDYVAKPLIKTLERYGNGLIVAEDTSLWEERQRDQKHFAFSTAAAILGLREFAEVAHLAGDNTTQAELLNYVGQLESGFHAAFLRDGRLHGTLEEGVKNDMDGALLEIIHLGVVTDTAVVQNTLERLELLKVASGGYRRVRGTYTDPAIFEYWYEQEEFLFVDFSLAGVYQRLGRKAEAKAILDRIIDKAAADHYLIPEMYVSVPCELFPGKVGDPTGSKPMIGYGAGAYIIAALELAQ